MELLASVSSHVDLLCHEMTVSMHACKVVTWLCAQARVLAGTHCLEVHVALNSIHVLCSRWPASLQTTLSAPESLNQFRPRT